jgi:hypothetical protein
MKYTEEQLQGIAEAKDIAKFAGFPTRALAGRITDDLALRQYNYWKNEWNMLMPVIEQIWAITGERNLFYHLTEGEEYVYADSGKETLNTPVEDAYSAALKWVRWYLQKDWGDDPKTIVGMGSWEIELPTKALEHCYHSGPCDADVDAWYPLIDWTNVGMSDSQIKSTLEEYGTWEARDLRDLATNRKRILWLAAANHFEEQD